MVTALKAETADAELTVQNNTPRRLDVTRRQTAVKRRAQVENPDRRPLTRPPLMGRKPDVGSVSYAARPYRLTIKLMAAHPPNTVAQEAVVAVRVLLRINTPFDQNAAQIGAATGRRVTLVVKVRASAKV